MRGEARGVGETEVGLGGWSDGRRGGELRASADDTADTCRGAFLQEHPYHHPEQLFHSTFSLKLPSPPALLAPHLLKRPTKHRGGSAEFAPDGRCSAQAVAPRRARRESTAN